MSAATKLRVIVAPYLFVVGEECLAKDVACWLADDRIPDGTVFEFCGEYWVASNERLVECDKDGKIAHAPREVWATHLYKYFSKMRKRDTVTMVLAAVAELDSPSNDEISALSGVSYWTVAHHLDVLRQRGYIERERSGDRWKARSARITDAGRRWLCNG